MLFYYIIACAKVHASMDLALQDINIKSKSLIKSVYDTVVVKTTAQTIHFSVNWINGSTTVKTDNKRLNKKVKSISIQLSANGIKFYINNVKINLSRISTNLCLMGCPLPGNYGGMGCNYTWKLSDTTLEKLGIEPAEQYIINVIDSLDEYGCRSGVSGSITFNYF